MSDFDTYVWIPKWSQWKINRNKQIIRRSGPAQPGGGGEGSPTSIPASSFHIIELTNRSGLKLLQRGQSELEHLEQTYVAKAHGRLSVLRQSPAGGGDVELVDELVQYLEAEDAMIDGGLEELGNVVGQFTVSLVVEPTQLGDATDELDEGGNDKVLKGRTLVGQVAQDVVAYVDPLGHGEVVPVGGDELREGVGRDEAGVVRLGVVEDVLALGDVVRRRLEAEEAGLCLGSRDGLAGFRCAGGPRVEGLAQRLDLSELLLVHGWIGLLLSV